MSAPDGFTDGRYAMAATDAEGARDPIGASSQIKFMREGMQGAGHEPALLLLVVADGEQDAAVRRIRAALDGPTVSREDPTA